VAGNIIVSLNFLCVKRPVMLLIHAIIKTTGRRFNGTVGAVTFDRLFSQDSCHHCSRNMPVPPKAYQYRIHTIATSYRGTGSRSGMKNHTLRSISPNSIVASVDPVRTTHETSQNTRSSDVGAYERRTNGFFGMKIDGYDCPFVSRKLHQSCK
jgi:hypothetical protein